MKQPKTFLLLSVIVAVLVLGIAYAAISSVTFNVTGNVVATGDQGNFKVIFTKGEVNTISGESTGNATIQTNNTDAVVALTGFTKLNDEVQVVLTIENTSDDIYALLSLDDYELTGNDKGYFELSTPTFSSNFIKPVDGTATLTFNVKLVKTPIDDVVANIRISFVAAPSHTNS